MNTILIYDNKFLCKKFVFILLDFSGATIVYVLFFIPKLYMKL